ncbi:circularly permuted type 2 ATP-grasp protein [Geminicoccus roseus]|uniref:circularly permuted type 2 ATP-grasp protein n=1 Tax=Geminicoccus roseus TaxID=404900 RepID=UPI0012FC6742|nr:circularly permuted type 2 ATP-grasp protein [Geminicoccus roseus]
MIAGRLAPPAMASGHDDLFACYLPKPGVFDEFMDPQGKVRPAWQRFAGIMGGMDSEEREASRASAVQLVRDEGAAFNVYADPDDRAFAWRLHTLPMLLAESEWRFIEAAVCQRAGVMSQVLADLYGERGLIRQGHVPPDLILGGGRFVHAMAGGPELPGPPLSSYAVDLARDATGRWVVLADQAEAPSGLGYALANRVAMTHGFADLFRRCETQRLVGYFQHLRDDLVAATGKEDGRIVMLAHEPDHPAYFGHAYLARYLGYTLAQTADLTVRDERLFLKTLDGLQRVDLLLRQIDGFACDPLEVPGSHGLGIAGLVRAVRSGGVQVVNRLGSGLVQNRVLAPFMNELTRRLTGADLLIQDAPAMWLGDPAARDRLFAEPDRWRVEVATARNDPGDAAASIDPAKLSDRQLDELRTRLERHGHRYMALAPVPLATIPAFAEALAGDDPGQPRLQPRHFAMRVYASLGADGTWRVLPGALLRFAGGSETVGLPNGFGAGDLWVLTDKADVAQGSILQPSLNATHLRRTGRDLLSRTADNLFWLGRYAERSESLIRSLRAVLVRRIDDTRPGSDPAVLGRLLKVLENRGAVARFHPSPVMDEDQVDAGLAASIFDPGHRHGLRETLAEVHRTATLVRDQISHDAWRLLSALHQDRAWRTRPGRVIEWQTTELLDVGLRQLTAFAGTEAENMTRNYAWRFIEMGRRIERAINLVDLLRGLVVGNHDIGTTGVLPLLLELGDSSMTYRSRYLTRPLLLPVLDLLLLDETNPRSIAWQLERVAAHVERLPKADETAHRGPDRRLALKMATDVRIAEIALLATGDEPLPALDLLLESLEHSLPDLSDLIGRTYFAHTEHVLTLTARSRNQVS